MTEDFAKYNDWSGARASDPDAHGQAAILLAECLLHALVARSIISVAQALEIVDTACGAKGAGVAGTGASPADTQRSLVILEAIRASLAIDL